MLAHISATPVHASSYSAAGVEMGLTVTPGLLWILGYGAGALLVVAWVLRALDWVWWTPRRLERALRAQGLKGSRYRFLRGDLNENMSLLEAARSKPMPFSHDIIPRVFPLQKRAAEEYGKLSFTWFGPLPRVTIRDPDQVREILSNKFGHYGKTRVNALGRFFIRGVVSYEGEKWVKHRRILNPAFHVEKLKSMMPAFSACCDDLVERWETMMGSETCYELNVWPELQSFTGDVISRSAFGSNYEDGRRIFELQDEQPLHLVRAGRYSYIPGYRFLPTKTNNRIKAIDREVKTIIRGLITKREEAMKLGKASTDDMLGLLMESNMQHCQEDGNKNAGLSTEDVIEECKLFYFAGQETTSVLLTWTMVLLAMYPSWQDRAREEVLQAFGKNKPDFDGMNHLKTVTMILHEVLRLYPPASAVQRQTIKTMKLGNVVYPPGVLLLIPILLIHHDPDLWGKDANEFKPERFAEGISKASMAKNDQVPFLPFGGGPRICIGQNFALLEAKMALCMILQRFSFELSPSYAHAPYTVITLHPQHGAQLMLRRL